MLEPQVLMEVTQEEEERSTVAPSYGAAMVAEIDRTVKKYTDNLLHVLEEVSARLSRLESRADRIESSMDTKLQQLENILREVQSGVQVHGGKEEIIMESARTSSAPTTSLALPPHHPQAPSSQWCKSKSKAKKEAKNAEKVAKRQQQPRAAATVATSDETDPLSSNYGDIPFEVIQSKFLTGDIWTGVEELSAEMKERSVLIRGAVQGRKKMAFLVVRQSMSTVQCVVAVTKDLVSPQMLEFAASISNESIVDIQGIISVPHQPVKTTTQKVEIQVRKIYCISRAAPNLPFNIEDASRSETEFINASQSGEQLVRVGQDTRLNHRDLDLRTPANQAIFNIQDEVEDAFRQFLRNSEGFRGIHTPKIIQGSSEGGAAMFKLDYKGQPACLAQSPQIHKQMAICGGRRRVFEVGPVFRAEDSYTHRHLCEFIGLDVEMEINKHYLELCDLVDRLFVAIFDHLNEKCSKEIETINRQYPFQPLKYLRKTPRLTYEEGIQMLKETGVEVEPMGDLNTEAEKKLGQLVREKHDTDFYILTRYPLRVRPFYTMPCPYDSAYSNSFDVFIRGEEIISGAQRIHTPELLTKRVEECGVDVNTISAYIDSFWRGVPPHGGFGAGLERVVMLFCGLNNIRKTSLFPRDPRRLVP